MALILLQPGSNPLGQFDGYTGETLNFKGGEICTWAAEAYPAPGAADVNNDGYINSATLGKMVPAVSRALLVGGASGSKPLFLSDDGIVGYGTIFGAVVGGSVGQQVNGPNTYTGALLGPHTATGSGKITIWDKPGLYGVTLDAVDTASNGLVPTNTTLSVGAAISFTPGSYGLGGGLLTPLSGGNATASSTVVGRLASFETNGSLVTTPGSLVAALNSPSGDVSSLKPNNFYMAVFWFAGASGGA